MIATTRLRTTLCVTLAVAVPTGIGVAAGSAGGAAPTPENIAVLPNAPTAQPMYAKERGFFLKQGIDARIIVLSRCVPEGRSASLRTASWV